MVHAKCYRSGYPRPRFVRDSFMSLDGEWDFCFDDADLGERQRWQKGGVTGRVIRVPFAYQCPYSGVGEETGHNIVWYSRSFEYRLPKGKRLLLHFEGADYFAKVWLNGELLGTHKGGYSRFTVDATEALRRGKNLLVVRCEDERIALQSRGKQRYVEKNVSCFYTDTTGLWKPVWAEEVPDLHIEHVSVLCDYARCGADFEFVLSGCQKGLTFGAELSFGGEPVAYTETAVGTRYGRLHADLTLRQRVLTIKPWSPSNPSQFYDVRYFLKRDGKVVDEVGSYCALVDYRTCKNTILFNSAPSCYFRMVLAQGYYPESGMTAKSDEELLRDVQFIKELGFNGVRMHQKIEDERFYYFCDMVGLFFWLEMPAMYDYTQKGAARFAQEWAEIVCQYSGYASLMAYVPINESWGVLQTAQNQQMQQFTAGLYRLTKALDPTRFVISNDGWEHTESDIVTVHNYAQTGRELALAYGDLPAFLEGKLTGDTHTRPAFAKGWSYRGQPVIVSEYGGIACKKEKDGWGYGAPAQDAEQFLARLKELTAAIVALDGCQGYCLTQLTDVMQEQNGLLTETRIPKLPVECIAEINRIKKEDV